MSKRNTVETFELFFTPRYPLLFLAGALLLAVMGNMASDLLKSYLGEERGKLWWVFIVSGVTLLVLVAAIRAAGVFRTMLSARREYRFIDKPKPLSRKGLIVFVSLKQRAHLEKAIAYHRQTLERVWLIATDKSRFLAEQIEEDYKTNGLRFSVVQLDEEWDLIKTKDLVSRIFDEQLGELEEVEVIADFTGGTKPMTVGMIFACLARSRSLEYVPAEYDADGQPSPLDPVEYTFDARTVALMKDELTET